MTTHDSVLRPMRPDDVAAVLDAQEPAAVAGLAEVFPQDRYPFPRDAVAARWRAELLTYELRHDIDRNPP